MGFQGGIRGLAFSGIEQRFEGAESVGDALARSADGGLGLWVVLVDQQVAGVAPVIAHTGGNHHDRRDFRPVLLHDLFRLLLEGCQVVQGVKHQADQGQRRNRETDDNALSRG